jgi:hypothetical protein
VSSIPQPDLTDFLTKSDVHNMPEVAPIPGEPVHPFRNGSLLVTRSYVDTIVNNSRPNLSNYSTKDEIPDLSDYATKEEIPDITEYVTKDEMYYDGDPRKDLRIEYHADRSNNEANHKNKIYIGGYFQFKIYFSKWIIRTN